jgi:hypothetical protein
MPRKGARMSKSEIWSLLQTVSDNIAILSAQVDCVSDIIQSRHKSMEEHGAWGVKNTRILSTRVPNDIARRWDEVMLCENLSTSSVLRVLVEDFVDEYNPINQGIFFVPRIPLSDSVRSECSIEKHPDFSADYPQEISTDCPPSVPRDNPRDKLIADIEETMALSGYSVDSCI